MSEIPGDLKFLKSHEWARVEGNGRVTVGISDHAQGLLGDLVYVELPNLGDELEVRVEDVDRPAGRQRVEIDAEQRAGGVRAVHGGNVGRVHAADLSRSSRPLAYSWCR